jgi:hypothetical protein
MFNNVFSHPFAVFLKTSTEIALVRATMFPGKKKDKVIHEYVNCPVYAKHASAEAAGSPSASFWKTSCFSTSGRAIFHKGDGFCGKHQTRIAKVHKLLLKLKKGKHLEG